MEDSKRIRLKVMGLSVGQIKQGAYALILEQTDGPVKIPVVIGQAEARAIAARMATQQESRPMVHDLFATFTHGFGIAMEEVFIHKFEDGLFFSEIKFTDGERRITLDARTSDAIAIAMRTGAPIYTTPHILHTCGFVMEQQMPDQTTATAKAAEPTLDDLERLRIQAEEREDYEEAARLAAQIKQKKSTPPADD